MVPAKHQAQHQLWLQDAFLLHKVAKKKECLILAKIKRLRKTGECYVERNQSLRCLYHIHYFPNVHTDLSISLKPANREINFPLWKRWDETRFLPTSPGKLAICKCFHTSPCRLDVSHQFQVKLFASFGLGEMPFSDFTGNSAMICVFFIWSLGFGEITLFSVFLSFKGCACFFRPGQCSSSRDELVGTGESVEWSQ